MRAVPRRKFVPAGTLLFGDLDDPHPIGHGQTISQTSLVEWMTELLELEPGDRVLEVGTGSGYQAAVLAALGYVDVYSLEIVPELAQAAAERLRRLGYGAVHLRQGDGYEGWPEFAPYQGIVVTAATSQVPPALGEQLAEGGHLVIPLGPPGFSQMLRQYVKQGVRLTGRDICSVAFVPFTRGGAHADNR